MNKGGRRLFSLCMTILLTILFPAGCAGDGATPAPADASEQASERTMPTSSVFVPRQGNGVDVVYFEVGQPCECMAEVGDAVEDSIESAFAQELDAGTLRFFVVVSDDPSNKATVEMFNAQPFDLFIVKYTDGNGVATPVYEIWNLMGDNEAIETFVEAQVRSALEGQP